MASRDKGRRKWGGYSQESAGSKLEKQMRAGGNRAAQALYRPGSGPLRKSGRTVDDLDHENIPQDKQKISVQHRLRQVVNSDVPFRVDSLADKLNDMNMDFEDGPQESQGVVDVRRRNKKPEQQLYVPKKVKEALAEQDTTKRSPVQVVWERDRERENSEDRDSQSNRSNRHYRSGGNSDRVREDFGKRYSGNRRSRQGNENEERWRSDSPLSVRSYGGRKDSLREVRQGSEPLFLNHTNEPSRMRDTRSVEPDKFQGKPPSGRRSSTKESMSKNIKLEHLPPRLQKKYLIENGLPLPLTNAAEDSWNGSSITFQGSHNYPHTMQQLPVMQNLPPSGVLMPQTNWSNTVPARSRGRGRLRVEELEGSGRIHRSVTPDQHSATSSRSHTPSQEYAHRSYDRRGSNSTMYTSMESLSRADSLLMPPPRSVSPATTAASTKRCLMSPESDRRNVSPPSATQLSSHAQRVNNNAHQSSVPQEKQTSTGSSLKSEHFSTVANVSNERSFDWCEEVELNEKLESERLSRSSSVLSLRESAGIPFNQQSGESGRRRKKKRRDKRHNTDRSSSRDKMRVSSRERQNNQQNRENDVCSHRNNSTGRHYEHRRKRNIMQHSPEPSKDRNYRNSCKNFDDLHRHRDRLLEENWRTGRKMSTCDSEEGSQATSALFSNATTNQPGAHQTPVSAFSSTPSPGVLVLSDANQTPSVSKQQGMQQQRTLFDPNNPNKPIVVTSPNSRVALQKESEEIQGVSLPTIQPGGGNTSHHLQGLKLDSTLPAFTNHDQIGTIRPSWYDPYSDSFRSAKDPYLLLDIERADLELQWILSSGGLATRLDRVMCVREYLQEALRSLLERDMKFCQVENVEQHFWKILFYNIIEMLRKGTSKDEGREHARKIMLRIIDEGTVYLESLLNTLETKYRFKLDAFLANPGSSKGLGMLGLALVSAQKILLFLGDLARYREQANETTNYGKSRQWYLKAQQLNPKNGKPYNQLALLAHYARRKLDAVYYYMRSLMASNPFYSARECLIGLFDENRKKYESMERKRKEEREWKERARMREKEGSSGIGGSLRRETWIHPGGRRVRRTTTTATTSSSTASTNTTTEGVIGPGAEARFSQSDLEELAQLTSVEVNKRFITSYLHVHGKLITKIGMETFQEAGVQMLKEFRALLQHSPLPLPGTRLLQLLALNMFAIESTQLKDSQMEQGYRSELQERALVVSLQMFNLILERSVSLLKAQLEGREEPRMVVAEDMQVLLPAIKIWCDWMLCHSTVWNPPPSCTDYRVGPPGDAWSRLATMVNLLEKLNYSRTLLIQAKDAEGREDGLELVKLPEDSTLAGFTPLMSNPQDPCYAEKTEDMEVAQVCLRISKILFFGQVFLCGLETPVLKLQKSESGISEYVSVVEASSTSTPSSPPEQSDSELLVESYSEDEDQPSSNSRRLPSCNEAAKESAVEIRSLIERKEELERRQRKQDRHRLRVQAILQKSSVSVEIEVRPRQLVPDTNCFIDYLPQLQSIIKATSGTQPIYTLMVPLVVLNELEGLARGADARDCPPASRAALDPEHVARVAESAKVALSFARSRNPAIRCLTTRGTVLTSSTFTVEEDVDKDGLTSNDDRILATCLSLCKSSSKDQSATEEGQPRRLRRDVVLLTEDRNLRVKALARDVPVREVPDFMQWAGLG